MKRILLALTLAFLSSSAQAQHPNFPTDVGLSQQYAAQRSLKPTSRVVGRRPPGCPRAWCGCFLSLRLFGKNIRELWLARNWARIGRPAKGPAPGVVAVYRRGRGGHVGLVKRVVDHDTIVLLSGNDGGAVRVRERSTRGVIAWRIISNGEVM